MTHPSGLHCIHEFERNKDTVVKAARVIDAARDVGIGHERGNWETSVKRESDGEGKRERGEMNEHVFTRADGGIFDGED